MFKSCAQTSFFSCAQLEIHMKIKFLSLIYEVFFLI